MNGFDYILAHTAFDLRGCIGAPLEALKIIQGACRCAKAGISGVIYLKGLQEICAAKQDGMLSAGN